MAMLQSETPNLDLPPTQFSAAHDHDDDHDNNDDDNDDVFDMMMMMVTLTFVVLMMMMMPSRYSPGAQEQAPVTGSQEAPL